MCETTKNYTPRRAEDSVLHKIVRENLDAFLAEASAKGRELPDYVREEFLSFLDCGVFSNGFVWLRCEDCGHETTIPFSCKTRGFCPSCAGRRMAEAEVHLMDEVFPEVPVRQKKWMASACG